jgi:hypothetical protein
MSGRPDGMGAVGCICLLWEPSFRKRHRGGTDCSAACFGLKLLFLPCGTLQALLSYFEQLCFRPRYALNFETSHRSQFRHLADPLGCHRCEVACASTQETALPNWRDRNLIGTNNGAMCTGELPVSLPGPIANPTTRRLEFCSLVLLQLDSKVQ